MIALTYLSDATIDFSEEELRDLLATSRDRNFGADVTGMLLYAKGHFIQTLEGDESEVEATFNRIQSDPRHANVIVAQREPIEVRGFPDWSMGFARLADGAADHIDGFNDFLDPRSDLYGKTSNLGRAGIFHRIFRDNVKNLPDDQAHS